MATKLYVGNINYSTTADTLKAAFAAFGTVVSATVITDRVTGQSKGFAFVEMETEEQANAAIEGMKDKELDGRKVVVNIARPKEDRPRGEFKPRFGGGNRNRY